jgi:hypothetical protein
MKTQLFLKTSVLTLVFGLLLAGCNTSEEQTAEPTSSAAQLNSGNGSQGQVKSGSCVQNASEAIGTTLEKPGESFEPYYSQAEYGWDSVYVGTLNGNAITVYFFSNQTASDEFARLNGFDKCVVPSQGCPSSGNCCRVRLGMTDIKFTRWAIRNLVHTSHSSMGVPLSN